ncbi:MAG: chromosome segregation SMC family protein [Spirochaetia bacterium]
MFLKTVEIFGFKSFADRSRIEFRDGISALLGPNGCGKSNVVDSIKWVLGEQSSKTLRAEKMEDVIFNGTESRKAMSVAEVTLTLVNDKGLLPIDVSEISVKRRVYRSGESEYYVNNQQVRLKELRELFYDTGIGKSAYSIMEQGKIDQILSNKPEERRYIFEEAAGITRYKIRGQEAERKLQRTEENMRQVESILSEVQRSYNTLKAQTEKTLRYRELREDIFQLELKIQLHRLKEFLEKKYKTEQGLEEQKKKRDEKKKYIDSINESLEVNLDMVNSMETNLIDRQKNLYGIDIEKNNCDSQIRILSDRESELKKQLEHDVAAQESLEKRIESRKKELSDKEDVLTDIEKRKTEISKNIDEFETSIKHAQQRIRENEDEISRCEDTIKENEKKQKQYSEDLRVLTDDIVTQLDQRLRESGYSANQRRELEEKIESLVETIRIQAKGKTDLLQDASGSSEKSQTEVMDHASGAFSSIERAASEFTELFGQYKKAVPTFIDEFLAPEGIITQKREIDNKMDESLRIIEESRTRIAELRQDIKIHSEKINQYRNTLEELKMNLVKVKTQESAIKDTVRALQQQIQEEQETFSQNSVLIEENKHRLKGIGDQIKNLREKLESISAREKDLQKELADLEKHISEKNKDLMTKEKDLKSQMDRLGDLQSKIEKIQMDLAGIDTEIKNVYSNFFDRYSRDLSEFEDRMYEMQSDPKELRKDLQVAKDELRSLGQVNLMAPEEFAEVEERYNFLNSQIEDLQKAKEDLVQITREIKQESTEMFLATYDKIKKNFHQLFRRLFGGGRAELRLSEPDAVLESGIDILAQPPGKKLENIALLSGGERSLTAIALLFATYIVKPSPFCILDEIDAALDESNVHRFINMLQEFSAKSQFIVITHNKKTVAGAKTLLGVTMEESGVSKIIAIRVGKEEEAIGANA